MSDFRPPSHPDALPILIGGNDRPRTYGIPVPLTPLVGREQESAIIRALLDAEETRLLTLTGPGGIGKTRLAIEVATRIAPDFAHGACFVPLAPVHDPGLIVAAVAQAFGIQEGGDRPVPEIVASTLVDRHLLLVLDNAEHLASAVAPWLADLLARCPRLRVLVTSRLALQIDGEQRYTVPPLPVSDGVDGHTLADNPAVTLFTQRTHTVLPDFVLTNANASMVVEICRRVDGIPLAIELAAARADVLTLPALLARLSDRLAVLKGRRRDVPEHHRTMRDAIAWSYDLLPSAEQSLFRRVAVFVGGFTVEAAEAIGGPMSLDLLTALTDHNLIRRVAPAGREARLWILETIREFGIEQLTTRGEMAAARDAHAAHYLQMSAEADRNMRGPDQLKWFDRLEAEHDNLRAAIAWLTQQERIEEAMKMATDIMWYRWIRGHFTESRAQLETLLAHPQAAKRTIGRAKALIGAGASALQLGEPDRAKTATMEALSIARECEHPYSVALALIVLSATRMSVEDMDSATTLLEESLVISRELNEIWLIGIASGNLGEISFIRGEMTRATAYTEKGLQAGRDVGDRHLMAGGFIRLARLDLRRGDLERAEPLMHEGVRLLRELGEQRSLPFVLAALAQITLRRGDAPTAATLVEESLAVAQRTGNRQDTPRCLMVLAHVARRRGEQDRAVQLLRESIALSQQLGQKFDTAESLEELAAVAIASGDMQAAARLLGATDGLLASVGVSETERWGLTDDGDLTATVRSALGDAAFAGAFGAGQTLTLDEAVTEAIAFTPSSTDSGARATPKKSRIPGGLTPRELEVLRLMADGLTNQDIADMLFLSRRTVTSHATAILGKLGFSSRTAAVAYAIRHGLA